MFQDNPFFSNAFASDKVALAGLGLAASVIVLVWIAQQLRPARRRWVPKQKIWTPRIGDTPRDMRDPLAQINVIAHVDFETIPLLNKAEARLLPVLEAAIREYGQGHRLMAQTSLGEILRPKETSGTSDLRKNAYASINSKRLDFAVFDRFGHLAAAIEYQGSGHYASGAFMRDAVKREALRKAGVPYIELAADISATEARAKLLAALHRPKGR